LAKLAHSFCCTLPRPWAGAGGTGTESAAALLAAVAEAEEPCMVNSISVFARISPFTSKSALSSKLMGLAGMRCAGGQVQVHHRLFLSATMFTVYKSTGNATIAGPK
jgi:hypothetical protein